MPFDRDAGRRDFPLRLGGQAGSRPARERVSFVVAHMTDRGSGIQFTHSVVVKLKPLSVLRFPVQWRVPTLRTNRVPPV